MNLKKTATITSASATNGIMAQGDRIYENLNLLYSFYFSFDPPKKSNVVILLLLIVLFGKYIE